MQQTVVVVSDDVMFWTRIREAALRRGHGAVRVGDEVSMAEVLRRGGVRCVVCDLDAKGTDPVAWVAKWTDAATPPRLVAYGSHVQPASLEAARRAGFDDVLPRSRFVREIDSLL